MKITKILIENYKSIKLLELEPNNGLNAFIGENSVGKSNIFSALNWVLGPVYPTFNGTKHEDHYLGNPDNKILIQIHFDDGNCLELNECSTDYYGNIKPCLNFNKKPYVKDEIRYQYCSAYLDINRKIIDYLPSNRWSLLGRFLLDVNNLFLNTPDLKEKFEEELKRIRDELLFSVKDSRNVAIMHEFIKILKQEGARQLNKSPDEFNVDLTLYNPWDFYRTLHIIVNDKDSGLSFPASEMGMGIQASLSVAILQAYSKLKLANNTPIFIDEPELFLHPQAQRNFYKVLRELVESGVQVFYTTHSPCFLSAGHFDEIFLVRKSPELGTYIKNASTDKFIQDLKERKNIDTTKEDLLFHYQNAYELTGDTQKANEAFFAKKIILVEGQSESLILPYFFDLYGYDYIKEGVSIVECGSKGELDRFYRLYNEFGIPCFIIFDGDKQLDSTGERQSNINKNKEILSLFQENSDYPDGTVHEKYLGFEYRLEDNLNFQVSGNVKGLKLFKKVKENITELENLPSWVEEVILKIQVLGINQEESELPENNIEEGEWNWGDDEIPF